VNDPRISGHRLPACAGLIAGPAAWAVNTQLGPILPYAECASRVSPAVLASVIAVLLALAGAWISWRHPWPTAAGRFTARLGALMGVTFAFALTLQGAAGLMLTGCER